MFWDSPAWMLRTKLFSSHMFHFLSYELPDAYCMKRIRSWLYRYLFQSEMGEFQYGVELAAGCRRCRDHCDSKMLENKASASWVGCFCLTAIFSRRHVKILVSLPLYDDSSHWQHSWALLRTILIYGQNVFSHFRNRYQAVWWPETKRNIWNELNQPCSVICIFWTMRNTYLVMAQQGQSVYKGYERTKWACSKCIVQIHCYNWKNIVLVHYRRWKHVGLRWAFGILPDIVQV